MNSNLALYRYISNFLILQFTSSGMWGPSDWWIYVPWLERHFDVILMVKLSRAVQIMDFLLKNLDCFYHEFWGLPLVHNMCVFVCVFSQRYRLSFQKIRIFNNIATTTQNLEFCGLPTRIHMFLYIMLRCVISIVYVVREVTSMCRMYQS